jgi:glutamine synthetase
MEDYHILQTGREEKYTGVFRKHLKASGIPTENSKGECGIGQHELNVRYADILPMADRHLVYKQCLKEVADQLGMSVTFMAKPFTDATGSGCHIHMSIFNAQGKNAFVGDEQLGPVKCSPLFKHFLGGWMKYTKDFMPFYAPTINSYKRFVSSSWAPTRLAWSYDNRTAGYRVVGSGQSLRIECRIPGADANPYLVFAASLASGLQGIREKIEPPPVFEGNIYEAKQLAEVPKTLAEAVSVFENSKVAKEAMGEEVVRHYAHFYRQEQAAYDKSVTDWERTRYFERI